MNLYLRLLFTMIRAWLEPHMSTRMGCCQWFRVWPNDIDAFGHMNNGRYLQIMDVARMRWLVRTGTVDVIRRRHWAVTLGGNLTRYRRPLRLLSRYRVSTRLMCWDDRWFFLEHSFYDKAGQRIAAGISRAAFLGAGKWVKTKAVMREVEHGIPSPPMPAYLRAWLKAETAMYASAFRGPETEGAAGAGGEGAPPPDASAPPPALQGAGAAATSEAGEESTSEIREPANADATADPDAMVDPGALPEAVPATDPAADPDLVLPEGSPVAPGTTERSASEVAPSDETAAAAALEDPKALENLAADTPERWSPAKRSRINYRI